MYYSFLAGTGKTYVLVEIIQQLLHHSPNSKILIATQSNSAANIIAARLVEENADIADTMLRVISKSLVDRKLPMNLRKYCASIKREDVDDIEPDDSDLEHHQRRITIKLDEMNNFRVIIGTCVGLGILAESDMNNGHFTHILIDEAAQCMGEFIQSYTNFVGPTLLFLLKPT